MRWTIPIALVALAAPAAPAGGESRPNVLLISVDTLRADHCSINGYERETTPFLERLAKRGTVFTNAYSASSWTPPSMASLFTSLPPHAHGVVNGTIKNHRLVEQDRLAADLGTIAEAFAGTGYRTAGVSTNLHLSRQTGFGQGFLGFSGLYWAPAAEATEEALRLAKRGPEEAPLFLWVHYMDPHDPYLARKPFIDAFAGDLDLSQLRGRPLRELRANVALRRDPVFLPGLSSLYDSEIRAVDEAIAALVRGLGAERGWIVAVTADHGESLLEHGQLGHGNGLYEPEVRIPLLLLLPSGAQVRRVAQPVSLLDVMPTLLDAAGLPPPGQTAGRSLLPLARGAAVESRPVVMELHRRALIAHAVRAGRFKLLVSRSPTRYVRLFDLERDPGERRSVTAQHPGTAQRLREVWSGWLASFPAREAERIPGKLDEKQIERLRSLGYID